MSTAEVSKFSGATLRQLQWWDETGRLCPTIMRGHKRIYSEIQARRAKRLKQMSDAGLSHSHWMFLERDDWNAIITITSPTVIEGVLVVPLSPYRGRK